MTPSPYFPEMDDELFPHSRRRTAESMVAALGTHSHILVMSDDERRVVLDRVRAYLRDDPETGHGGEFDLPMLIMAVRGIRAATRP